MDNIHDNNGHFKKITQKDLEFIYEIQYLDIFPEILNISQEKFFKLLQEQISLNLKIVQKTCSPSLNSTFQSNYSIKYQNDLAKITNSYKIINQIPEKNLTYLNYTNCYIHCNKNLQAIHICGNQLIKYGDLIFCTQCKNVYTEKLIKLYCCECHKEYFSKVRKISDKKFERYLPVTFIKNHCNSENEKINCVNCGEFLYYSIERNNKYNVSNCSITETYCFKCKKIYDMQKIEFKCSKCKKLFKSDAKLYNAFPEKIKKLLYIIHILHQKKCAFPKLFKEKKCKCDLSKIDKYYHNKNDMGILYTGFGEYENFIVCNKCYHIFDINTFEWSCPLCILNFTNNKKTISTKINKKNSLEIQQNRNEKIKLKEEPKKHKTLDSVNNFKRKSYQETMIDSQETTRRSITKGNNTDFSDNVIFSSTSASSGFRVKENKKYKKKKLLITIRDIDSNHKKNSTDSIDLLQNLKGKNNNNNNSNDNNNIVKNIEKYFFVDNNKFANKLKYKKINNVNIIPYIKLDLNSNTCNNNIQNNNKKNNNYIKKNSMKNIKKNKTQISNSNPKITKYIQSSKNLLDNKKRLLSKTNYGFSKSLTEYNERISNNYTKILDINYYKFIECIGFGSYGKTYLVEDPKTHFKYALKKLIIDDLIQLKETQDQYNMLLNLGKNYPEIKIVHIYGIQKKRLDKFNNAMYILMEAANCDWEKEILNRRKFRAFYSEKEILLILSSLVETFSNLQKMGICHRDIKPQNILCFGKSGFKITDFGEAKYIYNFKNDIKTTLRGTQLYMSPLLYKVLKTNPLKGAVHDPYKSDVFSLGMCFLFACNLDFKPLYDIRECENMEKIVFIVNKSINNRYSMKFVRLLIKMLQLNENLRPDFLELERILKSRIYI